MPVPGRDHAKVAEGGLGPAQELVALAVALVFALDVEGERAGRPEPVDLDGMVDDEVGRDERVHLGRVAAEVGHRVTHDREIDDRGNPGEVLEQDTGRHERDLRLGGRARTPCQQGLDVGRLDHATAGVAEGVLEQDLDRDRQAGEVDPVSDGIEPVDVRKARPERRAGAEWIVDGSRGRHERASFVDRAGCAGSVGAGWVRPPRVEVRGQYTAVGWGSPVGADLLATLDGCCPEEIGR